MLSRGISGGQVPWHPQGWDDWLPWRTHWGKGFLDLFGLRAEAKRVNVALALISQPMVVFLDEPTSGLDSKMANEVCAILSLGTVVHWFWLECWVTKLFVEVYDNIWQYDMTYIHIHMICMICMINTRRDLMLYTEDVCSFYFPDRFQKFVNTKPNSVQIFSLLTVVQHFSPFLFQERVGEGWLHHRGHGALTHQLCLFLVWWPPHAAGRFSQMTWWNLMISRNSFIPSFLLITYHIRTYIARRLDFARARVRIPGLFLKAVLKWEGMHPLYMCICAGRWCYGLCWSGVRSKAILCVLRLSFPRGAFSKITSKRFPALVICASCKPVLSPIRYARSKVILCQTGWWTLRVEQLDRWRMRQKWRMVQPLRLISRHIGPRAPEARTMSRMGEHGPVQVR